MKRFTRIMSAALSALMLLMLFASCGENAGTQANDAGSYTVGVIQYASHPSLDNCYNGVEAGLREKLGENVTIVREMGNNESATCDTIAKNFVSKGYDMIVAIATPAAVSAYSAAANSQIPVVFCAVSDPVEAGLVDSLEAPGGNCTGTSDVLDFDAQLNLISKMQPDAKKIGVLYTTSETNSASQLRDFTAKAEKMGFEVIGQGVQTAADIPQAAASLVTKVDCVNNFTDNNVVENLSTLLDHANSANIPVYGSEEEQVKNGCLACVGIDYIALGKVTGEMAADVLGGADASTMSVKRISEATPIISKTVLEGFKMEIPQEFKDAQIID